jgi:multimeric flavodoxin WrbA
MKVLAINGSPRKDGNTQSLLNKMLEGARNAGADCEMISLNDLTYKACQECDLEIVEKYCIYDDDMTQVYEKVDNTDILIIGSPVFFGNITAQLKAMVDRYQCCWRLSQSLVVSRQSSVVSKRGVFVCVSGQDNEKYFVNSAQVVRNFFATIGIKSVEELYCPGVDAKNGVLERPEYLAKAFEIGKSLTHSA